MQPQNVVEAVISWAQGAVPELADPRKGPESDWPLPDLAVNVTGEQVVPGQVAQQLDRLFTVEIIVAVAPEPYDVASDQLQGFIGTLMDEIAKDNTLGQGLQVERQTPMASASFEPPYLTTDDGATARGATVGFTVREKGANR